VIEPRNERVVTADGTAIAATYFEPADQTRGAVLIPSAMGVAQKYYAPFAAWLAGAGYFAATFDFRGMGRSRTGSLRGFEAKLSDWSEFDATALLDAVATRAGGKRLYWIGHSLAGQIVPFVGGVERLSKVITIASGTGYWGDFPLQIRVPSLLLWSLIAPLSVSVCGYFPGRRLKIVGDLPKGVIERWRRWCLNPEYAVGVEGEEARRLYAAVRIPIVGISFTDDELMSAESTAKLHRFYVNAPRTMVRITPSEAGLRHIGHFGFFRPEMEEALWRRFLLPELA